MRHFAPSPSARPGHAGPVPARRRALARLLAGGAWLAAGGMPCAAALPRVRAAERPEALLRGSGLPIASFGVYARAVDAAEPLLAVNPEISYAMASTTKVVTSLAALDLLGVNFRWRTFAYLRGPLENGRLHGDLLLMGGGDARLSTTELREWFGQLRAQGLRHIEGRILIDRNAFTLNEADEAHLPPPTTGRAWHVRPDAFAIDEGLLHVAVQPGRGSADVSVAPPLAGVQIANRVSMRGGCSAYAQWQEGRGNAPRLTVQGSWSPGCGRRELTLVPRTPAALAPRALAALWAEAGGTLVGEVVEQARRPGEPLIPLGTDGEPLRPWSVHRSEPLPVVLHDMNKSSNNVTARHLMLALSRGFPLRSATLPEARSRMRDWLARQGLAAGDVEVDNGSGLSRAERARPRALAQLLVNAWHAPRSREFIASLPVAGVDGTLQHRLQGGAAAGHAFLKTGTLLDTRALAGYVTGASGKVYAVAMMVNHPDAARATPALDRCIEWLARNG